jgi:hypothetical protein
MMALALGIELKAMKRTSQPIPTNSATAQGGSKMGTPIKMRMRMTIFGAPEHQSSPQALNAQWFASDFTDFKHGIPVVIRHTHRGGNLVLASS